jgi:outer membrane protein assembly factor BamD
MRRICAIIALPLIALLIVGCAGFVELKGKDYPDSARLNYEAGLKYLQSENYETAQQYFQLVKSKFAFSMYAKSAELLIADTFFLRDMHAEAVAAYKVFQRSHPNHECVPYAQFRLGEVYYDQIADNWWFMPPAYEKDQETTEKALYEFRQFLRIEGAQEFYYDKSYKPMRVSSCMGQHYQQKRSMAYMAKNKAQACMDRLIKRELYVAEFYLKRDKGAGAALRLEAMFRKYPENAANKDLVLMLARSYAAANMYKKARAAWTWISQAWPEAEEVRDMDAITLDLLVRWARYYESVQRYAQARIAWKYIQDQYPDSEPGKAWAENDIRTMVAWAEYLVSEHKYDKAREMWKKLADEHPDSAPARKAADKQVEVLAAEGDFWLSENLFDQAAKAWATLSADFPQSKAALDAPVKLEKIQKARDAYMALDEDKRPKSVWQLIAEEGRQELEPDPDPNTSAALPLPAVDEVFPGY